MYTLIKLHSMEQTVRSSNLFIDSSRSHTNGSKGDDFQVHLQDSGITAESGEIIRLTLDNFSMSKNFTDINANNSEMRVIATVSGAVHTLTLNLTHQDIEKGNFKSLATDFATQLGAALSTITGVNAFTPGSFKPAQQNAGNRILEFELTHTGAHNISDLHIQCLESRGDSYAIVGGDRVLDATDLTSKSVDATFPATNTVKVVCRYPAQRSTIPYIYIRAPGLVSKNIETQGLQDPDKNAHKGDTVHSDILGRAVCDQEWVQYTAGTGREFFLDINQRHLTHIQFRLTDSRNRPIGRKLDHHTSKTASGTGTNQSTLGNLEFSACVRIDIIKKRQANEFSTNKYQPTVPARFSGGVLNQFPNEHI